MSDPWIRVHSNARNLKVVWRAVEFLGVSPEAAVGLLVVLWGQVAQHSENGHIDNVPDAQLEGWVGWTGEPGRFARFVREKHAVDGRIREWDDYAGKLEERREKDRERKATRRGLRDSAGSPQEGARNSIPTRATRNDDATMTQGRDGERTLSQGSLHPRREKAAPKAPAPGLPADRSESELANDRRTAHAEEKRRHLKARAYADAHPEELKKIERQLDRELARTKPGPLRDEIRRGRLVAELLRRAESQPPPRAPADMLEQPEPAHA